MENSTAYWTTDAMLRFQLWISVAAFAKSQRPHRHQLSEIHPVLSLNTGQFSSQ